MKKYIFIILIFFANVIHGKSLQPLTNNTFEEVMNDEKANHIILPMSQLKET
jgi:hypothetical protein